MRRKDREITQERELLEIIARAKVCRVAYQDEEGLTIVPLSCGSTAEDGKLTLYFHGAKEGRKARAFERGVQVAFEMEGDMHIVEGATGCQYSCTYESIVGNGRACIVLDEEEKCRALSILMKQQTGRDFAFTALEARGVAVFKIEVSALTGKRRS